MRVTLVFALLQAAVVLSARLAFVSDLHYDPFYGQSGAYKGETVACTTATAVLGQPQCDSPLALIRSAFQDLGAVARPDHIIMGGDWLRHDILLPDAAPTYNVISNLLQNLTLNVVPCPAVTPLGNNDFVPDYYFDIGIIQPDPLLKSIAGSLSGAGMLSDAENATFSRTGYYSRDMAALKLKVVVLNTIIWSPKMDPTVASGADPLGQFSFMNQSIAAARASGFKVLLLSHIPPTVNMFGVLNHQSDRGRAAQEIYFQSAYEASYLAIVKANSDIITAQVFAHTHRFSYSAGWDAGSVPVIVLGSISPVYQNQPNYLVADYNVATGQLESIQQRFLPIIAKGDTAQWQWGPTLPQAFLGAAQVAMTSANINSIANAVNTNDDAFAMWRNMYAGNCTPDALTPMTRDVTVCFTRWVDPVNLIACAYATASPVTTPLVTITTPPMTTNASNTTGVPDDNFSDTGSIVALILVIIAFIVIVAVAVFLARRRQQQFLQLNDDRRAGTDASSMPRRSMASEVSYQ